MATDYNYFYKQAMGNYQPAMDAEVRKAEAGLADQGLLASTAGQGTLADVRNKYLAAARQDAQGTALNREQYAQNAALKVWEMLNARGLAKAQIQGNLKGIKFPNQIPLFGDYSKQRFLPPTSSSGPTGDPKEQNYFPMYSENLGPSLADRNLAAQQADSAASRAIQQASMQLARDRFNWEKSQAQKDSTTDPWGDMQLAAVNNLDAADPTGATAGNQAQYQPQVLLDTFRTQYGVDVMSEAKAGNEKAIAIVRTMYPLTWRQRISGTVGTPGVTFGQSGNDVWRNPDGSPATQQNWSPGSPWSGDIGINALSALGRGAVRGSSILSAFPSLRGWANNR